MGEHSVPNLRQRFKRSVQDMNTSNELLTALEHGDIGDVCSSLVDCPRGIASALNTPSLSVKHKLRTPLMVAAMTGDIAKWTATLDAFNQQFANKLQRDVEMRMQLANRDKEGMTMAMLATRSGNMAIVSAVLTEITQTEAKICLEAHDYKRMSLLMHAASVGPASIFQEIFRVILMHKDEKEIAFELPNESEDDKTILMYAAMSGDPMTLKVVANTCRRILAPHQVRELIRQRDSDGLNLLMHAVCSRNSRLRSPAAIVKDSDTNANANAYETTANENDGEGGVEDIDTIKSGNASAEVKIAESAEKLELEVLSRDESVVGGLRSINAAAIPVFQVAFTLIKECLWKDEALNELRAIDLWGRSTLTHAVLSGNELLFDAALGAIRSEVEDEEVEEMLETNEGEPEDEPMIAALAVGETSMHKLFGLRVSQVKKAVETKDKLSTLNAKIESFIPGKLIVLFQLLLPQIAEKRQLFLLAVMCILAPLLALGTSIATSKPSKYARISAETGKLSIFLGAPAMFFWGVGTSTIGQTSPLGWSPSLSATMMAAATICIPAIDSFLYSSSAVTWCDKVSCVEWRFNFKAWCRWIHIKREEAAIAKYEDQYRLDDLSSYSTFSANPTFLLQEAEEVKKLSPVSAGGYGQAEDLLSPTSKA